MRLIDIARIFSVCCVGFVLTSCATLEPQSGESSNEVMITQSEIAQIVAEDLSAQKLRYSKKATDLTDCSGIFLRASGQMADLCPGLVFPKPSEARASSAIARWYASRGQYASVNSVAEIDAILKSGDVVFFSEKSQKGSALSYSAIDHMGIVTEIERNDAGQIMRYKMFQGRKPGTNASITKYHSRNGGDRALGNGSQYLIGVAKMCATKSCSCGEQFIAGMPASELVEPPVKKKAVAVATKKSARTSSETTAAVATVLSAKPAIGALVKVNDKKTLKVKKIEKGIASYYAEYFHGRLTANGERFDMNAMTAAHKKLKFNTWVRVTRTDNGKSVIVRINDRGPFIKGRIIDLSKKAGFLMGLRDDGVAPVTVEILG